MGDHDWQAPEPFWWGLTKKTAQGLLIGLVFDAVVWGLLHGPLVVQTVIHALTAVA